MAQNNRGGVTTTGKSTAIIETSVTRPADAIAYAAGDVLSDDTVAPSVLTFSNCAQAVGGSGKIVKALCIDSTIEVTPPDLELWIFDTQPTAMEDNAAFDPTDAEVANVVAVIAFPTGSFVQGKAGAAGAGNSICIGSTGDYPFECGSASKDLYGILVVRNAYAPISAEVFTIRLFVEQD